MIKVVPKILLNKIEMFFVEKSMELLHRETIDTNRLRINNPLTVIKELVQVCEDLKDNKLKNNDYAKSLFGEAFMILSKEHYLSSSTININYFIDLIDPKNFEKKEFLKIIYSGNLIIKDNENYIDVLFEQNFNTILQNRENENITYDVLFQFSKKIEFLYTELISIGYSKFYLSRFLSAIFSGLDDISFNERFEIIKSLKDREEEEFEVVFGLDTTKSDNIKIRQLSNKAMILDKSKIFNLSVITNGLINDFIEKNQQHLLFSLKIKTKDYYQALNKARSKVLIMLDVIYLGHSNRTIYLTKECFIIGSKRPDKASTFPTSYQIDGYYKDNRKLYNEYLSRFSTLQTLNINKETINKINSGIRYLRMGGETDEIINKFLNYWIGLEYVFSTFEADAYTVGRLKDYFKRCHSLIYLKRNIKEFHRDIRKLNQQHLIPQYNENLEYLKSEESYDLLINQSTSPLIVFRAQYYRYLLIDGKKMKDTLEKHQKNLEWNLTRIYRVRNEIVHNAALKEDLTVLTSHLRYYLTFILNGLMDFFINHPVDVDKDKFFSIEDYFLFQDLKLSSLSSYNKNEIKFIDLIDINNPLEIII